MKREPGPVYLSSTQEADPAYLSSTQEEGSAYLSSTHEAKPAYLSCTHEAKPTYLSFMHEAKPAYLSSTHEPKSAHLLSTQEQGPTHLLSAQASGWLVKSIGSDIVGPLFRTTQISLSGWGDDGHPWDYRDPDGRIMSSTPPPSPKAPTVSSPEPKRRRTISSDNSVEQGEPSNARARNTTLNWSAYPNMIQRWIEMGNVPSPYIGSTSSSATLPSLTCTMEQAFTAFVFIITKELKEMKESTEEIPDILEREPQMEEHKEQIEHLIAELAATDQVHNLLVDRVTHLEMRVDTSDQDVGGILERVTNLEARRGGRAGGRGTINMTAAELAALINDSVAEALAA
ncbi:hypothetical protein L1987_09090 [Smallanthus sonchifolius]|uniref:Uncharacterized protein n=1 Tax=Smallanthus sonchifolius TaxID=185202 RepID=A0ACB9JN02_9ASTR|nr:hypothetical protein L1987_09090 [Smallanthus sonchifolius]